jgi:hypothetical protein
MNLKERYHAFKEWQKQPYQVKPLSQEEYTCATCGTTFQGNYCPRCGQSAAVGRYSLKTAFLLFLDVWGLGNRGMFRTIRDLLLRPGYMIRDYLGGMQMAYFPPFKMFFLLSALSILVAHGMNVRGMNLMERQNNKYEKTYTKNVETLKPAKIVRDDIEEKMDKAQVIMEKTFKKLDNLQDEYPSAFNVISLFLLALPLFFFFRNGPSYRGMYFSEFLVAIFYISNMYSIYTTLLNFLCINDDLDTFVLALCLIPLRQLTGYKWLRVIVSSLLSLLILMLLVFSAIMIFVIVYVIVH